MTAEGVLDHETIGRRPPVMRACRADREDFGATAHQQDLLVAAMTNELAPIGEIDKRYAVNEIRSILVFSHFSLHANLVETGLRLASEFVAFSKRFAASAQASDPFE